MRRNPVLRASVGALLAAMMLLASADAPRVSASGIPGAIHTVAGGGVGDGGLATAAAVNFPAGVAVDASGALYIADTNNCRVRRVSGGTITTVAGTGLCGYSGDGAAATAARLNRPRGVALNAAGDLYIADLENCRVRRVSGGLIATVAGTGSCTDGGDRGLAVAAALNSPWGVAVDLAGDLYIADYGNCRVRRVSGGVITTVAGTGICGYSVDGGAAIATALYYPSGVALDASGGLYISDALSCRVRRVSGGVITTAAGTGDCTYYGDGGSATASGLRHPYGVALDAAGDLYIADRGNHRVRRVSGGVITTMAGTGGSGYSGDGGAATAAALDTPLGVAVGAAGELYIADSGNDRLRLVSSGVMTTVAGTGSFRYSGDGGAAAAATLSQPFGVTMDAAGDLYISDTLNCRVRRVSGGVITTVVGTSVCGYSGDGGAATAATLHNPWGIAFDAVGDLYIADWFDCRVRKVSGGVITTVAGNGKCNHTGDGGAATAAQLSFPVGVALDAAGGLYIAETNGSTVRRVFGGVITTFAGTGTVGYSGDGGSASAATLNVPTGVAVDAAGDLYIADRGNCRVRRVSGGVITTVAGTSMCGYDGDGGLATASQLNYPYGVAFDAAGDLYIADYGNCRVRRVARGIISTVAGTGSCEHSGDDGAATAAGLTAFGVALDSAGDLYIADGSNNRVRVVHTGRTPTPTDTPTPTPTATRTSTPTATRTPAAPVVDISPLPTNTRVATRTAVPNTPTTVAATATAVSAVAGVIQAPDTGTGGTSEEPLSGTALSALMAGAAGIVLGASGIALRRRR